MAKATIKSKTGAIIKIEGTEKEVSNILSHFERTAVVEQLKESVSKKEIKKKEIKKRKKVADVIIELKEEGFFDKPKSLVEITGALEEKGRITPITSLSGIMISLVQSRLLGRKKIDGKWVYGK